MYRAALLTAVLVWASVAGTGLGAGQAGGVGPAEPRPQLAVLTLGEESTTGIAREGVDVTTAVAAEYEAAGARLDRYTVDARLEAAGGPDGRVAVVRGATATLEDEAATLHADARRLRSAYARRAIGAEVFVVRFLRLRQRAVGLGEVQSHLAGAANLAPGAGVQDRLGAVRASLVGYEGPVGDRTLAAATGRAPPVTFFAETTPDGHVVSAAADGRYVREAYREDRRTFETSDGIDFEEAVRRTTELYPAFNSSERIRTGLINLGGGLYQIDIGVRSGSIVGYLDGDTRDVFYEIQERQLDVLEPSAETATDTGNGTTVTVNRSFPGGPLRIATTDTETGAPVETTVVIARIDHETRDGVVWTVSPARARYPVTVSGPTGNLTTTVRPLPTVPLGAAEG